MTSSATDLSEFLYSYLCANTNHEIDGKISPCGQKATLACSGCYLVQYCCKECQKADWKFHKTTCRGDHMKETWKPRFLLENRLPSFMKPAGSRSSNLGTFGPNQYLWGNVPAVDILNVDRNEGRDGIVQRNIALLFAASGDLRNVIKTAAGLPEDYAGECDVVINDGNISITARNIIMLLTAMHFDAKTAVPIIIHLWYSALLPIPIVRALQESILPYVEDVCQSIRNERDASQHTKIFRFGARPILIALRKHDWFQLAEMFQPPSGLSMNAATRVRKDTMMAPARIDYVDRALLKMSPGRRTGAWRFRLDGILLSHGVSRKDFVLPNPTFFTKKGVWLMTDQTDPLDGWSYNEYITHATGAKNDVYGAFFNFLRSMLLKFCNRIHNTKSFFRLFAVDPLRLPGYLRDMTFDRIEVSNICDRGYVGVSRTFRTFSPMLKPKTKNPHATLLLLFLNAVREMESQSGLHDEANLEAAPNVSALNQAKKFMSDVRPSVFDLMLRKTHRRFLREPPPLADLVRVTSAMEMFGDCDGFFKIYLQHPDPLVSGSMKTLARACGMKVKAQHTIIQPWPYRITDKNTKAEFDIMFSQSVCGQERYMEFEKLADENDEVQNVASLSQLALE